jgi:putative endonuclease
MANLNKRLNKKTRKSAYHFGIAAEYVAILWLMFKGYRIIRRRFHCKQGEIDIIARKASTLVFIEVKARRKLSSCAESITASKLQKFHKAVGFFLMKNPKYASMPQRIDAIFIGMDALPQHLKNIA